MPEYIWEWLCHSELEDGDYVFAEGTVVVRNGFAGWKPVDRSEA